MQGRIELKAISGDVLVGIRRGSRVFVDANTVSGSTTSELELGDAPAPARNRAPRRKARSSSSSSRRSAVTCASSARPLRWSSASNRERRARTGSLATFGFSEALVGGDRQPVRHPVHDPRAAPGRRDRAACLGVRDRSAERRRVPAVRPDQPPGGSVGRPDAPEADSRRRRSRESAAARLDPDRLRVRRAHDLAALRGRLPRRDRDGVLRRRLPVVPSRARRSPAARRRKLEARDQPRRSAARRPGARRSRHRPAERTDVRFSSTL